MQISYAFFAEAAQLTSDGRVNVLGADVPALHVQGPPPWVQPVLALLVSVEFEPQECGRSYLFTAVMHTPDGAPGQPRLEQQITPPPPQEPDRLARMKVVLQINNVPFVTPGLYKMHVSIRDPEASLLQEKRVQLWVQEAPMQLPAA